MPRNYSTGSTALQLSTGGAAGGLTGSLSAGSLIDGGGVQITFDWMRFGSSSSSAVKGVAFRLNDQNGDEILNFKPRHQNNAQPVYYNMTVGSDDVTTGTATSFNTVGSIWYRYTVDLSATTWDLTVEQYANTGNVVGALSPVGSATGLSYMNGSVVNGDSVNSFTLDGANTMTDFFDNFEVTGTAIPEPSSTALLGLGGLALILRRRK